MRKVMLLIVVAIALMIGNLAALEFSLTIDQVLPRHVSGTLLITNPGTQDITLEFPSAGTFDLMVDGYISSVFYPDVLTYLQIPAGSTISQTVSYVSSTPLTPGSHVAQARAVMIGNPTAGAPQTFVYDPDPLANILDLEYSFTVTSVGPNGVSGTLQMHNPNQLPWALSFPNAVVARIFVDGTPPSALFPPMSITLQINPGETHTEEIFHSCNVGYSPGTHIAEARLFLNENIPVGAAQTFIVEPSNTVDEIAPALTALNLKVWPNPCLDHLSVSSTSKQFQTFSIYDLKGRKVFETSGPGDFIWDGRDFSQKPCPAGLYYVRARLGDRSALKRFVKL